MTYSPYGDRDSGGTRTDVDTEVHDDHEEDRADDGIVHDANGHDATDLDGVAAPFQRDSTDDESVGGDVVDQDGNVVEDADGDVDVDDRPDAVDAQSAERAESAEPVETAEYAEAPGAAVAEQSDAHDAEANADDAALAGTEAEAGEESDADGETDGEARADEAFARDVDAPEHAEETAERDSATEQAMAGDDGPTEVPAVVDDEHDEADAAYANGDRFDTAYADGGTVDAAYDDAIDTESDRATATDGGFDENRPNEALDSDAPAAGAVDADYVAVGVAEPMTESEVADMADTGGVGAYDATPDAADDAALDAAPLDVAAVDGTMTDVTAVGMMPGDAPVPDAPAPVPNADATHDRWQQIQLGFIDDPRGSVESARSLVVEAVEARISALRDRQTALDGWQSEATPDTEVLRAAIQGYRDMLNSLTDTP